MTLVLASAIFTSMLTFVTLKLLTPDGKLIGTAVGYQSKENVLKLFA